MGLLRNIGKGIGGLIFSVALIAVILAAGLAEFTGYESMKSVFLEIFKPQIEAQQAQIEQSQPGTVDNEALYKALLELCTGKAYIELPANQGEGGLAAGISNLTINCNDLRTYASRNESADAKTILVETTATAVFNSVYYKKYDCEFLRCMQDGQFTAIMSSQGHIFFESIQMYLLAGIALGAVVILVSSETWPERLKSTGIPMIFVGISYFLIGIAKTYAISTIPASTQAKAAEAGINMSAIIDKILAPMSTNFLIVLIIGIALTAGGYAFAFYEKRREQGNLKGVKEKIH